MIIDTHAHLDYTDFEADREAVLSRAFEAGVKEIISIGTDVESSRAAVALAKASAAGGAGEPMVWAAIGVHPCQAQDWSDGAIESLRELALDSAASHQRVVALGEIGLDYHRLPEGGAAGYKTRQAEVFLRQLDLAAELNFNVVVHQREAWQETLALLRPYTGRVRAVFHCFGGSIDQVQELAELGHLVSFTGIVTFKNAAAVQETARTVEAGQFMVETDCPYLAPSPYRGRRCEPAHAAQVVDFIAHLRGEAGEQVAEQTAQTAHRFFNFPDNPV